ncbi:MAG: hypothetical protein K0U39_05520 [Alphaproteobacteria bacterium]|nr:hypothetical protein [Alphaproteobacteria bacterium]
MTGTHPDILAAERTKTSVDGEIRRIEQSISYQKKEISKLEASANNDANAIARLRDAYHTLAQLEGTREKLKRESADLAREIHSMKQRLSVY